MLANGFAALLYAPWLPVAYRQAIDPPVPPWRTAPHLLAALGESWTALSLGQSAPSWLWPALILTGALYVFGVVALLTVDRRRPVAAGRPLTTVSGLVLATFGPLGLILFVSLATPLYHVRYLFTYSPAFYSVLAAGLGWWLKRARLAFGMGAGLWLAASAVTLSAFWFNPLYRADDHRAAVRYLQEHWRPGDVVLVNAGWPITALTTYWEGPIAGQTRLTEALPAARDDAALDMVTAGHLDGDPHLGWADPRSDFFALPAAVAERQVATLFDRYARVWHYRIYDTVNDPAGQLRAWLAADGQLVEDQVFAGEAYLRVQAFVPRRGAAWSSDLPSYRYPIGISVQFDPSPVAMAPGGTLYGSLTWRAAAQGVPAFATSLRLVGGDGDTWAQPPDERPLGPLWTPDSWPAGVAQRQPFALRIPVGAPPGSYTLALLVYDPVTGTPWPPQDYQERLVAVRDGLNVGIVQVRRPQTVAADRPRVARFGPLALVAATSPATDVAPGGQAPVELLWQAIAPPGEPLVVVVQLLGASDTLIANLEEPPVHGFYPTAQWTAGELVRDRHTLNLPPTAPPGAYRLVVGVYRAADRTRFKTPMGVFGQATYWEVKKLRVQGQSAP